MIEHFGQALVGGELVAEEQDQQREDRVLADEQRERLGLHRLARARAPAAQAAEDQHRCADDADDHRAPAEARVAEQRLEERRIAEIGNEAGADVLERRRERPDELAEQHVAGEAAEDQHAAERDDERRDLAHRRRNSPAPRRSRRPAPATARPPATAILTSMSSPAYESRPSASPRRRRRSRRSSRPTDRCCRRR